MVVSGNFAAIDLGSNTFHLIVFKDTDGKPDVLLKKRALVGIGKKGIEKNIITEDALERALEALKEFKKITEEYQCRKVKLTATSAFRNAGNKTEILSIIKEETGFDISIIDGNEEANLIYEGVKKCVALDHHNALIMDIGGGSVEFIICNEVGVQWKQSFEIGGIRLMERFHKADPITPENISELNTFLDTALENLFTLHISDQPKYIIGASGTFDSLCEIRDVRKHTHNNKSDASLSLDDFYSIKSDLLSKTYQERVDTEGLIPLRAEMIVVTCILIEKVIAKCNIKHIQRSEFALKEGLMYRIINEEEGLS